MSKPIEVYEWKEGAPRPGTKEKPRETCIDILDIPSDGQIPCIGDIILITDPGRDPMYPGRYRVLEREFLWWREPGANSQTPQKWGKMWLHVRRVEDDAD